MADLNDPEVVKAFAIVEAEFRDKGHRVVAFYRNHQAFWDGKQKDVSLLEAVKQYNAELRTGIDKNETV